MLATFFALSLYARAVDNVHTFVTGIQGRAVRVQVEKSDGQAMSDDKLIREGRTYAELVRNIMKNEAVGGDRIRFFLNSYQQAVTFGPWLTLLARQPDLGVGEMMRLEAVTLPQFFATIYPIEMTDTKDAGAMARLAVAHFRGNWLFNSSDAPVIDELELEIERNLRLREKAAEFTVERLNQMSRAEIDEMAAQFHRLSNAVDRIATRASGQTPDLNLIKLLGRYHVFGTWTTLLNLLREEISRTQDPAANGPLVLTIIETLAHVGRVPDEVSLAEFDLLLAALKNSKVTGLPTLVTKMRWARHVINQKRGRLPTIGDLRRRARQCTGFALNP